MKFFITTRSLHSLETTEDTEKSRTFKTILIL
jgi:hypothetical protein